MRHQKFEYNYATGWVRYRYYVKVNIPKVILVTLFEILFFRFKEVI